MKVRSNSRCASSNRMPRSIICWISEARSSRIINERPRRTGAAASGLAPCEHRQAASSDPQIAAGETPEGFDVFLARLHYDIVRQRRHRRLLVPADALEVVPHVLLVETRLSLTGGV